MLASKIRSTLAVGLIAASGAALTVADASATPVTFSQWTSTNSDQLHPELAVNKIAGGFEITSTLLGSEFGSLVALFLDFGTGWTDSALSSLTMASASPAVAVGSLFSYAFQTGIGSVPVGGACGNDGNINGLPGLPSFEAVACYKNTGGDKPTQGINPVVLNILDPDEVLTLASFEGVALRYKQSSNDGGSDKLFSSTPDVPSPVPLPAAGLLLLGALGGLGVVTRRRKAA